MECKICKSPMQHSFSHELLGKYLVDYFHCTACGLLQTEEPYWLDEAYDEAIALADTGIIQRNISISARLAVLLYTLFDHMDSFLDTAGGYGILTRIMRDLGFDYYWYDKHCDNKVARGFEHIKSESGFTAVTAFEVFEHLHDPVSFVSSIVNDHDPSAIVFSTELYRKDIPAEGWWYYAFNTGQHISFYQEKTLSYIARLFDFNFYSMNGLHIFSKQEIRHRWVLHLLTNRIISLPLALFVRWKLGSRTFDDHLALLNRIKKG